MCHQYLKGFILWFQRKAICYYWRTDDSSLTYISCFLVTDEANGPDGGAPLFELVHPVGQGWLGHQNHVGTADVPEMLHVTKQRYRLQSLAQTHLVSQNSVDAIFCKISNSSLSNYFSWSTDITIQPIQQSRYVWSLYPFRDAKVLLGMEPNCGTSSQWRQERSRIRKSLKLR